MTGSIPYDRHFQQALSSDYRNLPTISPFVPVGASESSVTTDQRAKQIEMHKASQFLPDVSPPAVIKA